MTDKETDRSTETDRQQDRQISINIDARDTDGHSSNSFSKYLFRDYSGCLLNN